MVKEQGYYDLNGFFISILIIGGALALPMWEFNGLLLLDEKLSVVQHVVLMMLVGSPSLILIVFSVIGIVKFRLSEKSNFYTERAPNDTHIDEN